MRVAPALISFALTFEALQGQNLHYPGASVTSVAVLCNGPVMQRCTSVVGVCGACVNDGEVLLRMLVTCHTLAGPHSVLRGMT